MKKLYLMLLGLILAMGANAADWYISGVFQGWSHCNANYKLTETTSGVYTIELSSISGEFLMCQGTTNSPNWNTKIGTNGTKVKEGVPYRYAKGANNFNMDGEVNNALVTLDTNAGTLLITGQAEENDYTTVYVVGDINGSGWNEATTNYPMTLKEGTDNVWETSITTTATSYFKMRAGTYVYGTGAGDVTPVSGQEYTASQSGNSFVMASGKTYYISFTLDKNADTGILVVTYDGGDDPNPDPEPNYDSWYVNILGDFNSWLDNGVQPVDGISTHTNLAIGTSSFKVKIWNGDKDTWYASTNGNVPVGEWFQFEEVAGNGTPIAGAKTSSVYNVEYNVITNQIKVTLVSEDPDEPDPEPDYDSWYVNVLGDFNSWLDNGVQPVDGISTHTDLAIGTSSFKVKIWNGNKDTWYASTNGNVPVGEWFQFEEVAGDGTPIEGAKASSVYNVEYNVITNQVKVTLVSEDPDPVEQPLDVTFDFTNIETIQAMNSAIPALDGWTKDGDNTKFALEDISLVYDNVTITSIKNPEITTTVSVSSLYRTKAGVIDLRFYKNNIITLAAPEGYYIVNFEFKGVSAKLDKFTSEQGTFTAATKKNDEGFFVTTFTPNEANEKSESIIFSVPSTGSTMRVAYINVTLAKLDETPEVHETLYLRAADNGWGADESNEMTYANGVYSITMTKLAGAFKVANSDWNVQVTTDNLAMETGVTYDVVEGAVGNMGMKDVLENVTITYDSASKKIQVTGTAIEGYSVSYLLHGQFEAYVEPATPENPDVPEAAAQAEIPWNDIEMTENNGIISAVVVPLAEEGSFVIFHKRDGVDYETIKSASGTLSADQTLQLTTNGGEDAKYQLNPDHKYTLEVDTNTLVASTRDGGSTGIESITVDANADVRYFNLQGVPVATPAPGLYIVVRNGVATKAYIR
ncbi:MAG: hypothetical protein NC343_08800 [Muribaculum sp.]|nr:hypothetical protein [Muribaculum sp.]